MNIKKPRPAITNESTNGLSNVRGSISMARTAASDSATSQFFINTKDNLQLDFTESNPGYCVFGKVVKGMDVVDKIAAVKTVALKGMKDVPEEPVEFKTVRRAK